MAGSITGGKQAAKTNMERYGADYYSDIGHKGGSKLNTKPKGFAYAKLNYTKDHPAHPANAGIKGGKSGGKTNDTSPDYNS